MQIPVTSFTASLLALFIIMLTFRVIRLRRARLIGIGDGGDQELARAIRVHANALENIPLTLVLLLLLELQRAEPYTLMGLSAALLVGRLFHAYGLSQTAGKSVGRVLGMVLTWVAMLGAALYNLCFVLMG